MQYHVRLQAYDSANHPHRYCIHEKNTPQLPGELEFITLTVMPKKMMMMRMTMMTTMMMMMITVTVTVQVSFTVAVVVPATGGRGAGGRSGMLCALLWLLLNWLTHLAPRPCGMLATQLSFQSLRVRIQGRKARRGLESRVLKYSAHLGPC